MACASYKACTFSNQPFVAAIYPHGGPSSISHYPKTQNRLLSLPTQHCAQMHMISPSAGRHKARRQRNALPMAASLNAGVASEHAAPDHSAPLCRLQERLSGDNPHAERRNLCSGSLPTASNSGNPERHSGNHSHARKAAPQSHGVSRRGRCLSLAASHSPATTWGIALPPLEGTIPSSNPLAVSSSPTCRAGGAVCRARTQPA